MLDTAAKFHSTRLGQRPADRAAGDPGRRLPDLESLGLQVRKGERGIGILAPCTYRPKAATSAPAATDSASGPAKNERGGGRTGRQQAAARIPGGARVRRGADRRRPAARRRAALLIEQAPAGLWDDLASQVTGARLHP